jgi:GNAT superfamily N-acetyltransferase
VLETKGRIAGFYSLREASALDDAGSEVELNHLYIEPLAIGEGFGKRLWQHACETARRLGFERMAIPADPFAESFYLRMGAVRVGEIASGSIPGRMLPLLHFSLVQPPSAYASDG